MHRDNGSGKSTVEYPGETQLANPGYFAKNKTCHYCKELGHVKNDCPKLMQKRSKNKCEYPGCTMKVGHTTDRYWEDPKNEKDRPVNRVSRIKKSHLKQVQPKSFFKYNTMLSNLVMNSGSVSLRKCISNSVMDSGGVSQQK